MANADANLTPRDFTYANADGSGASQTGQRGQYITLTPNANGDVVIHFNTNGGSTGATNSNMGSVTLTGVRYGSGAGQYDSVADLFGMTPGSTQILWATTNGFKAPATTSSSAGSTTQDFDWTILTNILTNGLNGA